LVVPFDALAYALVEVERIRRSTKDTDCLAFLDALSALIKRANDTKHAVRGISP
jgi:hypothetical protein